MKQQRKTQWKKRVALVLASALLLGGQYFGLAGSKALAAEDEPIVAEDVTAGDMTDVTETEVEEATAEEMTVGGAAVEEMAVEGAAVEESLSRSAVVENTVSEDVTNGDATSGDATSGDATSGNATSGDATSGNATSGDATSENVTPGSTTSDKMPVKRPVIDANATQPLIANKEDYANVRVIVSSVDNGQESLVTALTTTAKDVVELVTEGWVPTLDMGIFGEAKKLGKDIVLTVTNEYNQVLYSWSFSHDAIDSSKSFVGTAMDLSISFDATDEDKAGIANLFSTDTSVNRERDVYLSIAGYDGELPGAASLKVYVGNEYGDGEKVYLYYYNEAAKKIELMGQPLTVENGYITVTMTHCSVYFTSPNKYADASAVGNLTGQTQTPASKNNVPKTGDSAMVLVWVMMLLGSGIVLVGMKRKHAM